MTICANCGCDHDDWDDDDEAMFGIGWLDGEDNDPGDDIVWLEEDHDAHVLAAYRHFNATDHSAHVRDGQWLMMSDDIPF